MGLLAHFAPWAHTSLLFLQLWTEHFPRGAISKTSKVSPSHTLNSLAWKFYNVWFPKLKTRTWNTKKKENSELSAPEEVRFLCPQLNVFRTTFPSNNFLSQEFLIWNSFFMSVHFFIQLSLYFSPIPFTVKYFSESNNF